jgi:copper chaperone CopZ
MTTRRSVLLTIACAVTLLAANLVHAADPSATTISVQGMHCAGCASKVAGNLQVVAGVQKAEVNAERAVAIVIAKASLAPSPRAMWEAIEKAGYKPTKLVGPTGTFTTKPRS